MKDDGGYCELCHQSIGHAEDCPRHEWGTGEIQRLPRVNSGERLTMNRSSAQARSRKSHQ